MKPDSLANLLWLISATVNILLQGEKIIQWKGAKELMKKTYWRNNLQHSTNGWTQRDSEDGQFRRDKEEEEKWSISWTSRAFFLLTIHPFIKLLLLIRIRTMQDIAALEDSVAKSLRNSLWGLIHCRQCLHRTHLLGANSSLSLWGSQRKWKKWFPLPSNLYLIWDFFKNLAEMGYKKKI